MRVITIYQIPRETGTYPQALLAEPNRVYYAKIVVDKIGLFAPSKAETVEWQLIKPTGIGGIGIGDLLRRGRNLIVSTSSWPDGLVRFNLRRRRGRHFGPDMDVLNMHMRSTGIVQDETGRIWSQGRAKVATERPSCLVRSRLSRHGAKAEYWVLPLEFDEPHRLAYDDTGRIWFSLDLTNNPGSHHFGVLEPARSRVTGFTIDSVGLDGHGDIAFDSDRQAVWLTIRHHDAVYRCDLNSLEAALYADTAVHWPGRLDLDGNGAPLFVSADPHINTLDPDRRTGVRLISTKTYDLDPQVTEFYGEDLTVTETRTPVAMATVNEPETYVGPFIRWSVNAIAPGATLFDIRNAGIKAYFTDPTDARLGMITL